MALTRALVSPIRSVPKNLSQGAAMRFPSSLRHALLVLLALFLLVTPSAIYSCGPFLETAVFAFRDQPDGPAEHFAAGTLGIVRPGFRASYLVVAYRYLVGLKLDAAQQKSAIAVWNRDAVPEHPSEDDSIAAWTRARNQIPDIPAGDNITAFAPVSPDQPYFSYLNCPSDAFQTAAKTLADRSTKFGLKTAALRDWVSGQDAVFANCSGGAQVIPAELTSGDSLQHADRAYQIACANFYSRSFDDAVRGFDGIAKDPTSPWAAISPYLAARALVRKATLTAKDNQVFDPAPMAEAQKRLEEIVRGSGQSAKEATVHEPAQRLLNYVLFRTQPARRTAELEQALLRPDPGPTFKQDLWDYVLLVSHGEQAGDMSDWVKTFSGFAPNQSSGQQATELTQHSLDQWRKSHALPWLIAALQGIDPKSKDLPALLAAARAVAPSSPGYLTAQYHALESMAGSGQQDAARAQLDTLLATMNSETPPLSTTPVGSYNLLNDVRLPLATSLNDFLAHSAERAIGADEGPGAGEQIDNPGHLKKNDKFFPPYSAKVLQKRLPITTLIESAQSDLLPKNLRRDLARSSWTRAVLLNDMSTALKLQPILRELDLPLWKSMEVFRSATDDRGRHFAGILIILQNPGLKPSAREGYPRDATLAEIENYRDNWWCNSMYGGANWSETYDSAADLSANPERDPNFPFPSWLTESQKSAASSEWKHLLTVGTAPNYLASQVLDEAKRDPQNPLVPQALHLAVRATRFGCTNQRTSALSRAAFDYLHAHYPDNEWTAKTKYYY